MNKNQVADFAYGATRTMAQVAAAMKVNRTVINSGAGAVPAFAATVGAVELTGYAFDFATGFFRGIGASIRERLDYISGKEETPPEYDDAELFE